MLATLVCAGGDEGPAEQIRFCTPSRVFATPDSIPFAREIDILQWGETGEGKKVYSHDSNTVAPKFQALEEYSHHSDIRVNQPVSASKWLERRGDRRKYAGGEKEEINPCEWHVSAR